MGTNDGNALVIPMPLWRNIMKSLRQRGGGYRESGAFLLGKLGHIKITTFILYDDLDPHCLDQGIVVFDGYGFVELWKICEAKKLRVLADVHTHGSLRAFQSKVDKTNPMISTKGHIALILPNFAQNHFMNIKGIGIYKYLGNHKWENWDTKSGKVKWTLI